MTATRTATGPKRTPFVGHLLAFRRDPLAFLLELRTYGDIARFRLAKYDAHFLSHPDYVRELLVTNNRSVVQGRGHARAKPMLGEGLLTSEGEFHRRQRRLAQPAFHRQRIAGYAGAMTSHAVAVRDAWSDGQTIDIAQEMMRLTLSVAGETLFGTDVSRDAPDISEAITVFMEWWRVLMLPFTEILDGYPILPGARRFDRARARFDAIIYRMIEERRASGEDRGDLLSMLLLARDEESEGGEGMSDLQLRDEIVTLLLAGHETTANALAWTWYLLSQNPEAEAALFAELDGVLGGRTPTFDDIPKLVYTDKVFAEAMRVYPPAWGLGRRVIKEFEIGGVRLPVGSLVFASPYVAHRDARYFADPERFDPDRWTPDMKAALPKFAYFPFGGGPRQCIGEPFAWMEGVLLLATVAQRWRMRLVPGHPVELQPGITLRPKHGIRMTLDRR